MNKLIVCTHGKFGEELIRSAEMIIGPMENVQVFSLLPGVEMMDYRQNIIDSLDDNDSYIALVDLFGGTPSNTIGSLIRDIDVEIVSGVNLAMVLEVYPQLDLLSVEELKNVALNALENSGFDVKDKLLKRLGRKEK